MLSDNYNKMKELIKTYNMKQLIAEPTYFTENSSSLIDLIIIRNNNNILTSGVADTFIPDQIRHHCPTVVLLKFLRPHCKTFKRKIWNYKLADYTKYRSLLTDSNLEEKMNSTTNLDQNANDITDTLTNIAEQAIPSKHITVRPKEHPWINLPHQKLN